MKHKIMIFLIFSLFPFFCFTGCNRSPTIVQDSINTKGVMGEGDRIIAANTFGELTITGAKDNKRYLTLSGKDRSLSWKGDTVCVKLSVGEIEYIDPPLTGLRCDTNVKKIRYDNGKGPSRVKINEAKLYFDDLEAVEKWFGPKNDERYNPRVWTNGGLYVYWNHVTPEYWIFRKQSYLRIELFQIYVAGQKPSNLPGAQDDKIKVEHLNEQRINRDSHR